MVERIIPIAEGHGEVEALPMLIRRILAERLASPQVDVGKVIRQPRTRLVQPPDFDVLKRTIDFAARRGGAGCGILLVVDADDDCPRETAATLRRVAEEARPDVPTRTVLANREFEAWLIAAAISLRGHRRVRDDAVPPVDPEAVRDAKGHLQNAILRPDETYSPSVDQVRFCSLMSLAAARHCRSYRKLEKDIAELAGVAEPAASWSPAPGLGRTPPTP
jgi:hypothetical protein